MDGGVRGGGASSSSLYLSPLETRKRARWQITNSSLRGETLGPLDDDLGELPLPSTQIERYQGEYRTLAANIARERVRRRQEKARVVLPKLKAAIEAQPVATNLAPNSSVAMKDAPAVSSLGDLSTSFEEAERLSLALRQRKLYGLDEVIRKEAESMEHAGASGVEDSDLSVADLRLRYKRAADVSSAQLKWKNAKLAAADAIIEHERSEAAAAQASASMHAMQSTHSFDSRVNARRDWLSLGARASQAEEDYRKQSSSMAELRYILAKDVGIEVGIGPTTFTQAGVEEPRSDFDGAWILGTMKASGQGVANVMYASFCADAAPPQNGKWVAMESSAGSVRVTERKDPADTEHHSTDSMIQDGNVLSGHFIWGSRGVWMVHGSTIPYIDGLYIECGSFRGAPLYRNPHGISLFRYSLPSLVSLGVGDSSTSTVDYKNSEQAPAAAAAAADHNNWQFSELVRSSLVDVRTTIEGRMQSRLLSSEPESGEKHSHDSSLGTRQQFPGAQNPQILNNSLPELRVLECISRREKLLEQLRCEAKDCAQRYLARLGTEVGLHDIRRLHSSLDQVRLATVEVVEAVDSWRSSLLASRQVSMGAPLSSYNWAVTLTVPGPQLWDASPALQTQSRRHKRGLEPPHHGTVKKYIGMFASEGEALGAYDKAALAESIKRGIDLEKVGPARISSRPCRIHRVIESRNQPRAAHQSCELCLMLQHEIAPAASFLWKGWNYTLKLSRDLDFLDELPVQLRNFTARGNPFLLSDDIGKSAPPEVDSNGGDSSLGRPVTVSKEYSNGVLGWNNQFAIGGRFNEENSGDSAPAVILLSLNRIREAISIIERDLSTAEMLAGNEGHLTSDAAGGSTSCDDDEDTLSSPESSCWSQKHRESPADFRAVNAEYDDNGARLIFPQKRKPRPGRLPGVFCDPRSGEWSSLCLTGYRRRFYLNQNTRRRHKRGRKRRAAVSKRICDIVKRCRHELWRLNAPLLESLVAEGRDLGGDRLALDCQTAKVELNKWKAMSRAACTVQCAWRSFRARHMSDMLRMKQKFAMEAAALRGRVTSEFTALAVQKILQAGTHAAKKILTRPIVTAVEVVDGRRLVVSISSREHFAYYNEYDTLEEWRSQQSERYEIIAYDVLSSEKWFLHFDAGTLCRRILQQVTHKHRVGLQSDLCNDAASLRTVPWNGLITEGMNNEVTSSSRKKRFWEPAREAVIAERRAATWESRARMLHVLTLDAEAKLKDSLRQRHLAMQYYEQVQMTVEDAEARIYSLSKIIQGVRDDTTAAQAFSREAIGALERGGDLAAKVGWNQSWDPLEDGNNIEQLVAKRRVEAALSSALETFHKNQTQRNEAKLQLHEAEYRTQSAFHFAEALRLKAARAKAAIEQITDSVRMCHSKGYEALRRSLTLLSHGSSGTIPPTQQLQFLEHHWTTVKSRRARMQSSCIGAWKVLYRDYCVVQADKNPCVEHCEKRLLVELLRDPRDHVILVRLFTPYGERKMMWRQILMTFDETRALTSKLVLPKHEFEGSFASRQARAMQNEREKILSLVSSIKLSPFTREPTVGKLEFLRRIKSLSEVIKYSKWHRDASNGATGARGAAIYQEARRVAGQLLMVTVRDVWGDLHVEAYNPGARSVFELNVSKLEIIEALQNSPALLRIYLLGIQTGYYENDLIRDILDRIDTSLPAEEARWWRKSAKGEDSYACLLTNSRGRYRLALQRHVKLVTGRRVFIEVFSSAKGDIRVTVCAMDEQGSTMPEAQSSKPIPPLSWEVKSDALRELLIGSVGSEIAHNLLLSESRAELAQHLIERMVLRPTASSNAERLARLSRDKLLVGAFRLTLDKFKRWVDKMCTSHSQNWGEILDVLGAQSVGKWMTSEEIELKYSGLTSSDEHGVPLFENSWTGDGMEWWNAVVMGLSHSSISVTLKPETEKQKWTRQESNECALMEMEDFSADCSTAAAAASQKGENAGGRKNLTVPHNSEKFDKPAKRQALTRGLNVAYNDAASSHEGCKQGWVQELAHEAAINLGVSAEMLGVVGEESKPWLTFPDFLVSSVLPNFNFSGSRVMTGRRVCGGTKLFRRASITAGAVVILDATASLCTGGNKLFLCVYVPQFCAMSSLVVNLPPCFSSSKGIKTHVDKELEMLSESEPSAPSQTNISLACHESTVPSNSVEGNNYSRDICLGVVFPDRDDEPLIQVDLRNIVDWNQNIRAQLGAAHGLSLKRQRVNGSLLFTLPGDSHLPWNSRASAFFKIGLRGRVYCITAPHDIEKVKHVISSDAESLKALNSKLSELAANSNYLKECLENASHRFNAFIDEKAAFLLNSMRKSFFRSDGILNTASSHWERFVLKLQDDAYNCSDKDKTDPYKVLLAESQLGNMPWDESCIPDPETYRPWHLWRALVRKHIYACRIPSKACPVPLCGRAREHAQRTGVDVANNEETLENMIENLLLSVWASQAEMRHASSPAHARLVEAHDVQGEALNWKDAVLEAKRAATTNYSHAQTLPPHCNWPVTKKGTVKVADSTRSVDPMVIQVAALQPFLEKATDCGTTMSTKERALPSNDFGAVNHEWLLSRLVLEPRVSQGGSRRLAFNGTHCTRVVSISGHRMLLRVFRELGFPYFSVSLHSPSSCISLAMDFTPSILTQVFDHLDLASSDRSAPESTLGLIIATNASRIFKLSSRRGGVGLDLLCHDAPEQDKEQAKVKSQYIAPGKDDALIPREKQIQCQERLLLAENRIRRLEPLRLKAIAERRARDSQSILLASQEWGSMDAEFRAAAGPLRVFLTCENHILNAAATCFSCVDSNGDGLIDCDEWNATCKEALAYAKEQIMVEEKRGRKRAKASSLGESNYYKAAPLSLKALQGCCSSLCAPVSIEAFTIWWVSKSSSSEVRANSYLLDFLSNKKSVSHEEL